MRKLYAGVLIIAVCLIGNAAMADVMIFGGIPISKTGIKITGWGSGSVFEATDHVYTGDRCIKIRSEGYHEGGCITLKDPIDILSEPFDENTYLFVPIYFTTPDNGSASSSGTGLMDTQTTVGPQNYYSNGQEFDAPVKPKVKAVKIMLEAADGRKLESIQNVPASTDDGWYRIAVPFKTLGFKKGESFKVSRVIISTDVPDTIFVGQISTTKDDTQITCNAGDDQVVAINDVLMFHAQAEGGISQLQCSWNFGDRNKPDDPDGDDATGELVSHRFTKAGDYTVRLTVSDLAGVKKPAVHTVIITVND
ncbi:MAG: PKD domain-containing protein [Armatimonadota bacterium]